jgi:PncC family amidohydrolase
VRRETLDAHGAVSEETAREMVEGALRVFNGDVGISITGIAGPGGGTPQKPVGLTYIGIAVPSLNLLRVDAHVWNGDRETNKLLSVNEALLKLLAVAG